MTKQFETKLLDAPRISGFFFEPHDVWIATISYDFDGRFGVTYDPQNVSLTSTKCNNVNDLGLTVMKHFQDQMPIAAASATTSQDTHSINQIVNFGSLWPIPIEFIGSEALENFWDMNIGEAIDAISDLLELDTSKFGNLIGPWMAYGVAIAHAFNPKTQEDILSKCPNLGLHIPKEKKKAKTAK